MSLFSGITTELRNFMAPPRANTLGKLDRFIITGMLDQLSSSGIEVTEETAQKLTAFYRAIEILSQTVGMLPLKVYRRVDQGKEEARDHHLWNLLHDTPNTIQTAMEYREMMQAHLVIGNNAIAVIERGNNSGRPQKLIPIDPRRVQLMRNTDGNGELFYRIQFRDGPLDFASSEIHHVKGRSKNGLWGDSRLLFGTDAIGRGLAVQSNAAHLFANSSVPGGILKSKKILGPTGRKDLRKQWEEGYKGTEKKGRIAVLEEDLDFQPVSLSPVEVELIAQTDLTVDDISRLTGVPKHMLAKSDAQAYKNVEIISTEFIIYGLLPWLKRWEQAITRDLIPEAERKEIFVEFSIQGLLRGDFKTRTEGYTKGRQWGWYSANDIKRFENENTIGPKGDLYLVPMNMVKAEDVLNPPEPAPVVEPTDPTDPTDPPKRSYVRRSISDLRLANRRVHEPMFIDIYSRLVKRETNELRKGTEKHLRDLTTFNTFIDDFYRSFGTVVEQLTLPMFTTFSRSIAEVVITELGEPIAQLVDVEDIALSHTREAALRYRVSSKMQLKALFENTKDLTFDTVNKRLDGWVDTKAKKFAARELLDAESTFVIEEYRNQGIGNKRWQTVGANCPLCNRMQGKIVGLSRNFLEAGDKVDPGDGETSPLNLHRSVKGPPLHQGCDCMVVSSV